MNQGNQGKPTEKSFMATLLKTIEDTTGITLHDENIDYFFQRWRDEMENWREEFPYEFEGKIDLRDGEEVTTVAYANKALATKQAIDNIDSIEKTFGKWNRERNPVTLMVNDLANRGCSKATIATYKSVGNSFMRLFDYQPEFTLPEYNEFINQYENSTPGTKRTYRDILKLLWEVQGMDFPLKKRRYHVPHSILPIIPPMFSANQIAKIIKAVKERGTAEEKYYFCMATNFAPRRIELSEITAQNFSWNGSTGTSTGTLIFNPHKHGTTRRHHIAEELMPYLKEYSFQVKPMTDSNLTRKFWRFVNHLDLPVPKLSKEQKQALREKRQRPRQYGWHAFRYALTTALVEAGLSDTMIRDWMGWRSGNPAAPLVATYYTGQDVDTKIQAKHPFIKLWK